MGQDAVLKGDRDVNRRRCFHSPHYCSEPVAVDPADNPAPIPEVSLGSDLHSLKTNAEKNGHLHYF